MRWRRIQFIRQPGNREPTGGLRKLQKIWYDNHAIIINQSFFTCQLRLISHFFRQAHIRITVILLLSEEESYSPAHLCRWYLGSSWCPPLGSPEGLCSRLFNSSFFPTTADCSPFLDSFIMDKVSWIFAPKLCDLLVDFPKTNGILWELFFRWWLFGTHFILLIIAIIKFFFIN